MAAKRKAMGRKKEKARPRARAKSKRRGARMAAPGPWRTECKSLAEVRGAIDALDARIVPLLCQRHYFVTQAAKFKPSVAGVIVQSRVEEIVARVRAMAAAGGVNPATMEEVYRALIAAFTADEQNRWRELHAKGA